MQITEAQRLTLKAFIQGDGTLGPKAAAGDYDGVANGLNAAAPGPFVVWRSKVGRDEIMSCITLATFTPTDNAPASGGTTQITNDQLRYGNLCQQCALKQQNIHAMVYNPTGGFLVTARTNVRQALNDGLTSVPSGASGATQDAGWLGAGKVRLTIQRNATLAEKVLSVEGAGGAGTTGTPGNLGAVDTTNAIYAEGLVQAGDIGGILA